MERESKDVSQLRAAQTRLLLLTLFAIAFAFVEASVVVYLRALYYPEGFSLPLKLMGREHVFVELAREAATLVMLAMVGGIAGNSRWQRVGYFSVAFGVWDLFYYVWLKAALNWPATLTDWDILFLIPVPWVGPVVAPVLISCVLIGTGTLIILRLERGRPFVPGFWSWALGAAGTAAILFSFMSDTEATLHGAQPLPYRYELLVAGLVLYVAGYFIAVRRILPGRL
jgi:hypothetical protein